MSFANYLIEKKLVYYQATPNYGLITENSILLDDLLIFNEFLISYRIHKIRCWQNKQLGIIGIQLYYKDRDTNEEIISINKVKHADSTLIEFNLDPLEFITGLTIYKTDLLNALIEFNLDPLEFITGLTIYKTDLLNGFSICTNKRRKKLFGYDVGEQIIPESFEEEGKNVILGFFFTFEHNLVISSIGCYYLNRIFFSLILYSGILYLRIKLKDEEFRKEVENKLDKLEKPYIALYKICLLPNIQFYGVLKYSLS